MCTNNANNANNVVPPPHPVAPVVSPVAHLPVASAPILEVPVPSPAAVAPAPESKNKLVDMLEQLEDMGFHDKQQNIALLVQHNFNLALAISALLNRN